MRLRKRVAIVTGAARGIGQAYCLALAREGARVVAADVLSCAETVAQVQQAGGEVLEVTVDVTELRAFSAMTRGSSGSSTAASWYVRATTVMVCPFPWAMSPRIPTP